MLSILHEDGAVLALNKPPGLLTQAPLGIDSLEHRVKRMLAERQPGQPPYLGIPHRLDRPVSGVIAFAKNLKAARKISQQFEGRLVRKIYWALVAGDVAGHAGTWTDSLYKLPNEPRVEVVDATHPEGRVAVLRYRVQQRLGNFTWLEIELETGRTHQIRVQAASRGHPLLGDRLYGSQAAFGPPAEDEREQWIALHARSLAFQHPVSKQPLQLEAPVPTAWEEFALTPPARDSDPSTDSARAP